MSSTSSFYLLAFSLLLQGVFGVDPLFNFCSNTGNFTAGGPYETNLNKLFDYLSYQAPPSGFGVGSIGQNSEQTYGLTLCRGDVSSSDCKTCIVDAGFEILKRCPYNKGAIIWYDNCLLKYSNMDFFGQTDLQNRFYMYNLNNVSDPVQFNQKTKELLRQLATEAYANQKFYSTGTMELGESHKLYGLTQCTRDISRDDCKKCLDEIIGELPSCCDGKEGGRVVGGSCNFRYEIYPFVNA
ncbi:Stress-antifung domain-containing protein [Cephalotus follicularis]|uniref:Stress-antifung domain-containing protein n=1 Tax=Cephalotus follicularis TaxID=3775 RepID=A0A1Q3CIA5_CEPFO|nr:Stress-antifung domain-containing protein [Cephalotus follicularis]